MLAYQIRIALLSLRRTPVLSALVVGAIAVGIAISTAILTIYYIYSGNPIPDKSDRLFYVQVDSWNPDRPFYESRPDLPPEQITYRDMKGIMPSDIPTRQSGMFVAELTVLPEGETSRPYRERVRMCFADFFPMFEVPFAYGSGWDRAADRGPEPVVVIDSETNRRLFGGADSVGRSLRIEDRRFTIVGVVGAWRPMPRFYDPQGGVEQPPEAVYMPFDFVRELEVQTAGNLWTWKGYDDASIDGLLASEAVWIQMWVELDSARHRQEYLDFLAAYVMEQKRLGRFPRPLNNRLLDVMEGLEERQIVPQEATQLLVISLLFLLVCSVNLIGILLGKFLARASEVGVRRALGASRRSVFLQHLVECELVGVLGGAAGIALSVLVLEIINRLGGGNVHFQLDAAMIAAGVGLSLVAGAVAGLYPAWRICRLAPATYLKLQ